MAESILKLRVDSTEYDNKIKRAAEGLQRYAEGCRKAGGTLEQLDEGVLEFTQALGKMNTSTTSARGKVSEMTKAFTDLSMEYKQLTQEEKNAPFGKALAQSLDELKTRIQSTKQDLDEITQSLNGKTSSGGGGLFSSDKLSGMLQVFGGNLMTKAFEMATGAAMNFVNTIKDAAAQGIEMAKSGEGIRMAFERINKPGLLDNLRQATHNTVTDLELMAQAVKFNDFRLNLDQMGTLLSFAQQKAKDTGQSVDYMVDSIVTGLGRQSLMILDNLGLSAAEIKERMKETGDMTTAVADIIRDQMKKAGDYVETAADRAAQADTELKNAMEDLGRTLLPLEEEGNKMWMSLELGAIKLLNDGIKPLIPSIISLKNTIGDIAESVGNSKVFDFYINALGTVADKAAEAAGPLGKVYMLLKAIGGGGSDGDVGAGASVGALGLPDFSIADIPEITVTGKKPTKTKGTKGSKNTPDIADFNKALAKSLTGSVDLKEVKDALSPYQMMLPEIKKNILDIKDADLGGALALKGERQVKKEIEDINKSLIQQQKAYQLAGQAAMSFGAALQGIQDPATKAAGTVVQAVASIALGFATASAQANTAGTGWGWLAWLAAGASAMATTIATIHSLTGYAQGGMVKGNSYSGDNIPALVGGSQLVGLNAGEVILNAAQQQTLAGRLQNGGGGGMQIVGELSGEKIVLVANRYFRRTGQGEIVTW